MTGIMCAMAGSGGSIYTGTANVTVGTEVIGSGTDYGKTPNQGSIVPTTWASTGLSVYQLDWRTVTSPTLQYVTFRVSGAVPNNGWNTLEIAGVSFSRSAASYATDGASYTYWTWNTASNPFGTTVGATKAIVWS